MQAVLFITGKKQQLTQIASGNEHRNHAGLNRADPCGTRNIQDNKKKNTHTPAKTLAATLTFSLYLLVVDESLERGNIMIIR